MFGFQHSDLTDITVLLDRSGSMQAVHEATVEGFQTFVEKQRQLGGACRLTLAQFDTHFETVYRNRPIHKVPRLELRPRGGTALLDAMGRVIGETAGRLSVRRQPARVILVTITDGQENSSREFTRDQVFSLVRQHTDRHDWQFVFLGANQDAIQEAARMGIDSGAAMTYRATDRGARHVWAATGEAVARHRCAEGGKAKGEYFTFAERQAAND